MDESGLNATIGLAGGAGTVIAGTIVVLMEDDLLLGLLLGVATGALLSGGLMLFVSHRCGTFQLENPNVPVIFGVSLAVIGLIQFGNGVHSDSLSLVIFGFAIAASGGLFVYIGFSTQGGER